MPWARFTPPSWSTTRVISRMTDSVKPWTRREISTTVRLRNDHVTFDGVDLDAAVLEPLDPALERALVTLELERHPAVVSLHVGAADVDHEVEVLHETIDDRLLDECRRKGQADAHAGHREHQLNALPRSRERSRPRRRPSASSSGPGETGCPPG